MSVVEARTVISLDSNPTKLTKKFANSLHCTIGETEMVYFNLNHPIYNRNVGLKRRYNRFINHLRFLKINHHKMKYTVFTISTYRYHDNWTKLAALYVKLRGAKIEICPGSLYCDDDTD